MPRMPRIAYENAFYHIFNRGVAKQPIFLSDRDYDYFLRRLESLTKKKHYDHTVYAYVLMPNHFHLLIGTRKIPIAKIMTSLLTSYSMYFNRTHKRVGTLFQNRFKSKLCNKDSYFLGASRYIILNPVAARLVKRIEDYAWSNYQEIFGSSSYKIIKKSEITPLLGDTLQEKNAFLQFLHDGEKNYSDMEEEYSFTKEAEGSPKFTTLAQKKYLRRKAKRG
jgi:putative transposase